MSRLVVCVGAWLCACGPGGPEAEVPALVVRHFDGVQRYRAFDGTRVGGEPRQLLRRTYDPDAGTIEDLVYSLEVDGLHTVTVTGDVDADAGTWTFQWEDALGPVEGSGTFLSGEPWAWTDWVWDAEVVDGDLKNFGFHAEGGLTDVGFSSERQDTSPDGLAVGSLREDLDAVEAAAWEASVAEILGE